MDFFSYPHLPVLEVFQNINLSGSLRGVLKPSVPVAIIGKPVLSRASLEDLIPGFRPGEFILQLTHDAASLCERSVYLRWGLLFLMAMARAFFVPIMMTSRF
jgi:hypothetical protein